MDNLLIKQTQFTPKITLDAKKGLIEIVGDSYPINTFEFYKPFLDWIVRYFETSAKEITIVNIAIDNFNSGSSKLFFDLLDLLEDQSKKYNIKINWIFNKDNEVVEEMGEDFLEEFENLNIKLIAK